ncbi:MAG: hypothetical protein JST85_14490 [Acidobacteria bacterium]|nr:hypothetical protein [Acidobacteriota bacterium]
MLVHELKEMTETIGLRRCCDCTAELRDRDKFCRHCGARQGNSYATSTDLTFAGSNETKPLERGSAFQPCTASPESYTTYSGQLIRIVAESMSARTSAQSAKGWLKRLICTLITIPIWMLIVMLSPLDAYAAAKAAAGCVDYR